MRWHVGKRPPEPVSEPLAHHEPEPEPPQHHAGGIFALQRSAGNQALQKLMTGREGDPIPEEERQKLESGLGRNLSDVRIHRNEEVATEQGATAFTSGRDIYFAPGGYGSEVLAHEVAHVIQQQGASHALPGEDPVMERQAAAASSALMAGQAVQVEGASAAPTVQRQPAPGTQSSSLRLLPTYWLTLDNFDNDKFELTGDHKTKLDEFAQRLKNSLSSAPSSVVTITGFADAPGTELHNLGLGQQRANTVRDYLIARGVPAETLRASSLGEHSPVVETKGHEARNRRVEIEVLERESPAFAFAPPIVTKPLPQIPAKTVDLTYHPRIPTPSEEFADRLRQIDKAVREAEEAEKARPGTSVADRVGRIGRDVAKKLGMAPWIQDRVESLARDLPTKGGQAVVDLAAGDRSVDAKTKDAIKAIIDALMRMKIK